MSVGEHSTASGEDSEDLLALLEQQCVASMGLPMAGASSSKRTLEQSEQESDDDEAWSGISEEDAAEKESQNVDEPAVIEFSEPRREMSAAQDKQGYKQFMSSSVAKLLDQKPESSQKRKRSQEDSDLSDEEDMKNLDATLQQLISTIPESEASQATHSGFKRINHSIQDNTPLPLRRALQAARLKRTKAQVTEAKQAGLLRPHSTAGAGEQPALTKHEHRKRDGTESKRKREARGIAGVAGQMVGGATTLKLSKREIDAVNSGRGHELQRGRKRLQSSSSRGKSKGAGTK